MPHKVVPMVRHTQDDKLSILHYMMGIISLPKTVAKLSTAAAFTSSKLGSRPSSRRDVTPLSVIPQGLIAEKYFMSVETLKENPWLVCDVSFEINAF